MQKPTARHSTKRTFWILMSVVAFAPVLLFTLPVAQDFLRPILVLCEVLKGLCSDAARSPHPVAFVSSVINATILGTAFSIVTVFSNLDMEKTGNAYLKAGRMRSVIIAFIALGALVYILCTSTMMGGQNISAPLYEIIVRNRFALGAWSVGIFAIVFVCLFTIFIQLRIESYNRRRSRGI